MLWRIWIAASALPLGAAAALAGLPDASGADIGWAACGSALVLVAVTGALARGGSDAAERARNLAMASSVGWLGVPVISAIRHGWWPGPWPLVAVLALTWVVALFLAGRAFGPAPGPVRWLVRAGASVLLGGAVLLGLAWAGASLRERLAPSDAWATLAYDLDAQVATLPLPRCQSRVEAVQIMVERGANPAVEAPGDVVWFDAATGTGRRQIHRLDRNTGAVECWTCEEAGNNVRAAVGRAGRLVFETDRNASFSRPDDTDIQLSSTRPRPVRPKSMRLTWSPGPDEFPLFGPGQLILWSTRIDGRYAVVAAAIRRSHGGTMLGSAGVVASAGSDWIAPLAWSADSRALVLARGNPFGALQGVVLDPATQSFHSLEDGIATAAGFNADGGFLAYGVASGRGVLAALPAALGFALAPHAAVRSRSHAVRRGSALRAGATGGVPMQIKLPEDVRDWGDLTGLALTPDASTLIVGQRSERAGGVAERLLEVDLACEVEAPFRDAL